jgi:hypothetical protein
MLSAPKNTADVKNTNFLSFSAGCVFHCLLSGVGNAKLLTWLPHWYDPVENSALYSDLCGQRVYTQLKKFGVSVTQAGIGTF